MRNMCICLLPFLGGKRKQIALLSCFIARESFDGSLMKNSAFLAAQNQNKLSNCKQFFGEVEGTFQNSRLVALTFLSDLKKVLQQTLSFINFKQFSYQHFKNFVQNASKIIKNSKDSFKIFLFVFQALSCQPMLNKHQFPFIQPKSPGR